MKANIKRCTRYNSLNQEGGYLNKESYENPLCLSCLFYDTRDCVISDYREAR